MNNLKIKAQGENSQAGYYIFNKPIYMVCPKSGQCRDIEKLLLAFSLVFSICSWILGVFANLVVEDHSFNSIA